MKNLQCVLAQGGVSFDRVVKISDKAEDASVCIVCIYPFKAFPA